MTPEPLLSVQEFCERVGIYRSSIYYHIHKGRVRVVLSENSTTNLPMEKTMMIPEGEVYTFLAKKSDWMRKPRKW